MLPSPIEIEVLGHGRGAIFLESSKSAEGLAWKERKKEERERERERERECVCVCVCVCHWECALFHPINFFCLLSSLPFFPSTYPSFSLPPTFPSPPSLTSTLLHILPSSVYLSAPRTPSLPQLTTLELACCIEGDIFVKHSATLLLRGCETLVPVTSLRKSKVRECVCVCLFVCERGEEQVRKRDKKIK